MDMIVLEEKAVPDPTLFVEKRDGRRVIFDVDKIDKALHKAAEKVMDVTPLVEKRLSTLVERIVEEIHSRFPQGVKIYEIQNIVEHELLEAKEYAWQRNILPIGLKGILSAQKQQISTSVSINFSTKTRQLSMRMLIKIVMFLIPSRDLTAGIVGEINRSSNAS